MLPKHALSIPPPVFKREKAAVSRSNDLEFSCVWMIGTSGGLVRRWHACSQAQRLVFTLRLPRFLWSNKSYTELGTVLVSSYLIFWGKGRLRRRRFCFHRPFFWDRSNPPFPPRLVGRAPRCSLGVVFRGRCPSQQRRRDTPRHLLLSKDERAVRAGSECRVLVKCRRRFLSRTPTPTTTTPTPISTAMTTVAAALFTTPYLRHYRRLSRRRDSRPSSRLPPFSPRLVRRLVFPLRFRRQHMRR